MPSLAAEGTNQERTLRLILAAIFGAVSVLLVVPAAYASVAPSAARAPAAIARTSSTHWTATPKAVAAPPPTCRVTALASILAVAQGGCDGYGGYGADRLVVQCNGSRGVIIYVSGAWMNRWQSWWYSVWCPGGYGYRATSAWFEHRNW
jgi:hypothetical protein